MKKLYWLLILYLLPVPVWAAVAPITGIMAVCVGTTTTLNCATAGGVWSVMGTAGTINTTTGVVTGVSSGSITVLYTVGTEVTSRAVTVYAGAPPMTGASYLCGTASVTMGHSVAGGTWSSSATSIATVATNGVVTGVASGTVNISYILGTGCSTYKSFRVFPATIDLVGCNNMGVGDTLTFHHPQYSVWSSSNSSKVTVLGNGKAVGISPGTATIFNRSPYVGCDIASKTITVTATTAIKPITGSNTLCSGDTLTAGEVIVGGTWVSSNTACATVGTSGLITAIAGGSTTVTYTTAGGQCMKHYYINALPGPITPSAPTICETQSITFNCPQGIPAWGRKGLTYSPYSECYPGDYFYAWGWGPLPVIFDCGWFVNGYFTNSDPSVGDLVSAGSTAYFTGLSAGTTVITAVQPATQCSTSVTVTVNPNSIPPISGSPTLCIGTSSTYSIATTGGSWSSSNPVIATIDPVSGVATGMATGIARITYTATGPCAQRIMTINVNPTAGVIFGNLGYLCVGATRALSSSSPGGTWSSSDNTIATVNPGTGLVTGMSAGLVTISYIQACGNYVTTTLNVNTTFPITGVNMVCPGAATYLSTIAGPGTWSSSLPSIATVNSSGGVLGVASGTTVITFTPAYCLPATMTVTVQSTPVIVGPSVICQSTPTTYTASPYTGTWVSSSTTVIQINATSGIASGISVGNTATITFTAAAGCMATKVVSVQLLPFVKSVTGGGTYCIGDIGVPVGLSGSDIGFDYQLYKDGVALGSPWPGIGGPLDFGPQTAGVYTVRGINPITGCVRTMTPGRTVTAITAPGTINGTLSTCAGAAPTTLSNTVPGGTWSSSNTAVATIGTNGQVTPISAGTATISYSMSCGVATAIYTVNATTPPITGPDSVCNTSYVTFTNILPGGTWSSSNSTIANVTAVGAVWGQNPGTATISYNAGGTCGVAMKTVTVKYAPDITGPYTVCGTAPVSFSNAVPGGIWTVNNVSVASIGLTSGILTSIGSGNVIVTYTMPSGCMRTFGTAAYPDPGMLVGCNNVGVGESINFGPVTGGLWQSSTPSKASVSTAGVVQGLSVGTTTISLISSYVGCVQATRVISVTATALVRPITGYNIVCPNETETFISSPAGGTWSSSDPTIAAVNASGIITGYASGNATITYSHSAGSAFCIRQFYVNTNQVPLTGPSTLCSGDTIQLSPTSSFGMAMYYAPSHSNYPESGYCASTAGYYAWGHTIFGDCVVPFYPFTYSSADTAIAKVLSAGVVRGMSAGTTTISYTSTLTQCSSTRTVTVAPHTAAAITGVPDVCTGSSTTLNCATPGGIWSSGAPGIAVVNVSGIVSGVSPGTAIISYHVSGACFDTVVTAIVTVGATPVAGISGTAAVCAGATVPLTGTGGGTWNSSMPGIATVSSAGILTGVTAGTAVLSYSVSNICGTAVATTVATVSPLPDAGTITAPVTLCELATGVATTSATGGSWTSSHPSVATITGTGFVSAHAVGSITISYTIVNGCGTDVATHDVIVNPLPDAGAITGASTVCVAATIPLISSMPGGVWSSSVATLATINSIGVVSGVLAGVAPISYTVTNSCGTDVATTTVTVNPLPDAGVISGAATICNGATMVLSASILGGSWTSSNTAAAIIGSAGNLTAVAIGGSVISYSVTNSCGTDVALHNVVVNPLPDAGGISGVSDVCITAMISLSASLPGGAWSSGDVTVATVGSTGVVSGVAAGTTMISYTVTNSCGTDVATVSVTVNPLPDAGIISGAGVICVGASTGLSSPTPGGTWVSSNITVAAIGSTGFLTSIVAGTTTISYTVVNGCGTDIATHHILVSPMPDAGVITGTLTVCESATISLASTAPGGAWTSSNASVATVGSLGIVSGYLAGTTMISYTVTNVCGTDRSTATVTVNPLPDAGVISGVATICEGVTTVLSASVPGGTWASSNIAVATIVGGILTASTAGVVHISYAISNSCGTDVAIHDVVVNPLPDAGNISGATSVCEASSVSLLASMPGGTWSSSDAGIAIVGSAGTVTGTAAGTVAISYTVVNSCGTDVTTHNIVVTPLPDAGTVSGIPTVCAASSVSLLASVPGGTWSSSDVSIASVSSAGAVTGITAGMASISYTVTNGCGTDVATIAITVNALPDAGVVSGGDTICVGTSVLLSTTTTGGVWTSSATSVAWVSSTGLVTGVTAGTVIISYSVANSCGNDLALHAVVVQPTWLPAVTITAVPGFGIIAGQTDTLTAIVTGGGPFIQYQWVVNSTLVVGATTATFISNTFVDGDSVSCMIGSDDVCSMPTFNSVEINVAAVIIEQEGLPWLKIYPNPVRNAIYINGRLNASGSVLEMDVVNILGQSVFRKNVIPQDDMVDEVIVPGNNLANGVYILKLRWASEERNIVLTLQR